MKFAFLLLLVSLFFPARVFAGDVRVPWWDVQSVDTMKYSRDVAGEKLSDPAFDATIDRQVKAIADIGATHVAIGTPYDDEFVPFLARWVKAARKYRLNVWFRGNFSGWEKWFGYQAMTPQDHKTKLKSFITNNRNLFADGDIFTGCPECENGAMGDPRQTHEVDKFRQFLIDEYKIEKDAFAGIDKQVTVGFNSANGDVAKLIMDKKTTAATGGVVVIDHYVATPEKLIADIKNIETSSGGKVFLGEFGVPIPGINDPMTEDEQAAWIKSALDKLLGDKNVVGLNYWVNTGGSTQLWNEDGTARHAATVLKNFYSPPFLSGKVVDSHDNAISGAVVISSEKEAATDSSGKFYLPILNKSVTLTIRISGYEDYITTLTDPPATEMKFKMTKLYRTFIDDFLDLLANLFSRVIL